jgi:hypothetical protein
MFLTEEQSMPSRLGSIEQTLPKKWAASNQKP